VSSAGLLDDKAFESFEHLGHTSEWFEFAVPNYDQISTYRQRSSSYRKDAQRTVVDSAQFRSFLVVWHLKDWSLRNADGEKAALSEDKNGTLSQKSIEKVYSIAPAIMDAVLTALERRLMLS
jgi:hypothetical protein